MWTFEGTCYNGNKYMSAGALTMYGSYAYLFIAFFVDRFVMEPRRKRKQRREAANGQGLSNGSLTRETTAEVTSSTVLPSAALLLDLTVPLFRLWILMVCCVFCRSLVCRVSCPMLPLPRRRSKQPLG